MGIVLNLALAKLKLTIYSAFRFGKAVIDHIVEVAIADNKASLLRGAVSVEKAYVARNFENRVRVSYVSYGTALIESIASYDPFDLSAIDNFFENFPNLSLNDFR